MAQKATSPGPLNHEIFVLKAQNGNYLKSLAQCLHTLYFQSGFAPLYSSKSKRTQGAEAAVNH